MDRATELWIKDSELWIKEVSNTIFENVTTIVYAKEIIYLYKKQIKILEAENNLKRKAIKEAKKNIRGAKQCRRKIRKPD